MDMIEKISEFLRGRMKPEEIGMEVKYFDVVEPDRPVFAIDSGYRKIIDDIRGSLYFLRFGYVMYEKDKRIKKDIKETFLYLSDDSLIDFGGFLDEEEISYFKGKMWDFIENRGLEYEVSEKMIIGGISRLLELKIGKELEGIKIFDFPFDFRFEIHKKLFEEIPGEKIGLAKRSRLREYVKVLRIRRMGRWYVESEHRSFGKDFFVKYGKGIKCVPFRTSIDDKVKDFEELFGKIAYYSDETKMGYIFPLIRVDKLVRVGDTEVKRIRRRILSKVGRMEGFDALELKF